MTELKCPVCGSTVLDKSDYVDYAYFSCSCEQCFFYIRTCDRINPKDRVTQQELDDFYKILELNNIISKEEEKKVQKGISITNNTIKDMFPRKVLTQQVVELAFFSLLLQNGKTTTLEVKEKLRDMNYEASQQEVSDHISTIFQTIAYATDNYTCEDVRKDVADDEDRMLTLLCSLNIKNVERHSSDTFRASSRDMRGILIYQPVVNSYSIYTVILRDFAFVKTEEELREEKVSTIKEDIRRLVSYEDRKYIIEAAKALAEETEEDDDDEKCCEEDDDDDNYGSYSYHRFI